MKVTLDQYMVAKERWVAVMGTMDGCFEYFSTNKWWRTVGHRPTWEVSPKIARRIEALNGPHWRAVLMTFKARGSHSEIFDAADDGN